MIAGSLEHDTSPAPGPTSVTIRAFCACPLPDGARRAAATLQRRLQQAALPLRLTPENDLHVTALFIGEVEVGRALALWEEVVPLMTGTRPSFQRIAGVLCLPAGPAPRVVCLQLEGDPGLQRLHQHLADAATRSGIRVDRRPFLAHATIARVRQPAPPTLDRAVRRLHGDLEIGSRELEPYARVVLYRSDLGPGGARYTELASVHLGGAPR